MTDLNRLKELFDEWGVVYALYSWCVKNEKGFDEKMICLRVDEGSCEKIKGYYGFYTEFKFDNDGKFTEMGAYE